MLGGFLYNERSGSDELRANLQSAREEQQRLTDEIKQLRVDYSRTVDRERELLEREAEHIKRIRGLQDEIRAYRESINSNSELISEGRSILEGIRKKN